MRVQLKDPEVRRKAWPGYTFGCKRVLFSSDFLPALQRINVDLLTDPIARIEPGALVTADGARHEVDCIIWATGFRTNDFMFPMEITGAGGSSLRECWAEGAHAHLGISVPGFPNMFVLYGPNTNTSGGSIIVYLEAQSAYVRQALEQMRDRGAGRSRCAPMWRPRATAPCRPASPAPPGRSATRGTETSAGGSSPTGPATCASTCNRPRRSTRASTRSCPSPTARS
jgi:cation diffusion facilitator CzcD-associated flavoprotein CzcO